MWYICTWRLLSFIMDCSVCLVALFASIGSSNGMVDCIEFSRYRDCEENTFPSIDELVELYCEK